MNNIFSNSILDYCKLNVDMFESILAKCHPFTIKGVLHSEMLLFCSLIDKFDCKYVIESGRAQGQSTEILARWQVNKPGIISIDKNPDSEDYIIANKRLDGLNAVFLDGDSTDIIPKILERQERLKNNNVAVLIDGPKGKRAYRLACYLFNNYPSVKLIGIHDMHNDNGNEKFRKKVFYDFLYNYCSDDKKFVEEFKYIDDECWKKLYIINNPLNGTNEERFKRNSWYSPYSRVNNNSSSYGPTLMCLCREGI